MTKSEEIARLAEFVSSLPTESYLADFMAGALAEFESGIRSDCVFPRVETIHALEKDKRAAQANLSAAESELRTVREQVKTAERAVKRAQDELESIRSAARVLASR